MLVAKTRQKRNAGTMLGGGFWFLFQMGKSILPYSEG